MTFRWIVIDWLVNFVEIGRLLKTKPPTNPLYESVIKIFSFLFFSFLHTFYQLFIICCWAQVFLSTELFTCIFYNIANACMALKFKLQEIYWVPLCKYLLRPVFYYGLYMFMCGSVIGRSCLKDCMFMWVWTPIIYSFPFGFIVPYSRICKFMIFFLQGSVIDRSCRWPQVLIDPCCGENHRPQTS